MRYRNVTNIYFRAVPYDWNIFLQKNHSRSESLNETERKELLAKQATLEWSANLPATPDYKERTEALPEPNQLKSGFYFLIASHKPDFSETDNQITFTDIWVSDLALVLRPRDGNTDGFVLEANSGEPVAGAEVMAWRLDNQGNRVADPSLTTDENGLFSMKPSEQRGYLFRARHNGRELATQGDMWVYDWQGRQRTPREAQTVFFTDRAIYRPGQTIQYKGICLRVDQEQDNYEVLKGETVEVAFRDVNGKEIERQQEAILDEKLAIRTQINEAIREAQVANPTVDGEELRKRLEKEAAPDFERLEKRVFGARIARVARLMIFRETLLKFRVRHQPLKESPYFRDGLVGDKHQQKRALLANHRIEETDRSDG